MAELQFRGPRVPHTATMTNDRGLREQGQTGGLGCHEFSGFILGGGGGGIQGNSASPSSSSTPFFTSPPGSRSCSSATGLCRSLALALAALTSPASFATVALP